MRPVIIRHDHPYAIAAVRWKIARAKWLEQARNCDALLRDLHIDLARQAHREFMRCRRETPRLRVL